MALRTRLILLSSLGNGRSARGRGRLLLGLALTALAASPAAAAVPPVPSQPTATCDATVAGKCYVNGSFTISSFSPGAHHYRICRSNDTAGWGGCNVVMTTNTGPSFTVSGSHLPSNGFRRAFYFSACDSADNCTSWGANPEAYVQMDTSPPSAPGNTSVPCAFTSTDSCWVTGTFTVSAAPASDSGSGVGAYHICRSHDVPGGWAGCNVNLTLSGGTSFTVSGPHLPTDGNRRAYYFRAQDRVGNWGSWNGPRYVRVDRFAPTVSATGASSAWRTSATAVVQAGDATGGAAANAGLKQVRYRWDAALNGACTNGTAVGVGSSLTAPEGDHRLYLCARDQVGRVSHWNGRYRVDSTPPTKPGPTTVACDHTVGGDCWVDGSFVMTVTPASDSGSGVNRYHICRSHDVPSGWAGCNVTITTIGSTVYVPSGSQLPADGMRRAYYFRARDHAGNHGPWNDERYVRVDRYPPTASATNASTQWFPSRTATVIAADTTAGSAANAGLAAVRYRWNATLNGGCTNGTATSSGAVLTVPEGDNTLYLCARDQVGRTASWSGTYRVDSGPPTAPGPTTVACAHATTSPNDCWVTGDFVATVTPATDAGGGVDGYRICRSNDVPSGWAGCNVDMVPVGTGGTSFTVSGAHLPSDGFRRAYYFQARDTNGNWGPWNDERYVRVDRHAPTVSASNASSQWFTARTATVGAADATAGAGANSGLAAVRYRWNAPLNAACSNGTATSNGAVLTVPAGDNALHLCARDLTGRVAAWSGSYRVDATAPTLDSLTVSDSFWSVGDDSTYQITAKASDAGSGVRELRALINLQGSNAANPRGNYSWRDQSLGYLWTADQVACTGGGFASKRPDAFNPHTATLVGCTTSLSGGQRTVTFTIRPEAAFGEFGPVHDISFWSRDFLLQARGWQNHDLNFASGPRPPAAIQVRNDAGVPLSHNATVDWGAPDHGSGFVSKTFTVKNVAPAGSANLVLEHTPSNVEITGSSAFQVGGTLASPLAVGQQDTFQVRLDTSQAGSHAAVLKIWHSDPSRPIPLRVNLAADVVAEPVVTAVERDPVLQGQTKVLIVRGSHLKHATVAIATLPLEPGDPPRVYPTAELVTINAAGTRMEVRVNASAPGVDGFYNIGVETPGGATAAQFRVVGPAPVIDVWTPSEPIAGQVHVLQVMGENLAGANVVPMTAGIHMLEVDNSDAKSLSGLMFISGGVPPGPIDLRIDGTGGSTMLPMDLRPDIQTPSLPTRFVDTGPSAPGALRPRIVLQDPISAHRPEDIAAMFGIGPDDELPTSIGAAERDDASRHHICFSFGAIRTFSFSAILVSLLDDLSNPLTREAINALLPGQSLDFTSLTLAVSATLQLEFFFRICENGITDLRFCIRGGIAVMVPLVGGWALTFDFCFGINQQQTLAGAGRIDNHTYSTSNGCVQANDLSPGSLQGQRPGRIQVNCCENATISLQTSGVVFETPFVAQGPLIETELICVPDGLNLVIEEVSFLDDLTVKRDQVGSADEIQDPVWSDPDFDGVPLVANNGVAYVRGQAVRALAKLSGAVPSTQPRTVRIRAESAQGITLESQDLTIHSGEVEVEAEMIASGPLPNMTRKYEPLELDWSYSVEGGAFRAAGSSSHIVYVTLAPPLAGGNRHLTMTALDLAIVGGASTPLAAAQQTWSQFAGPANVRSWENRTLAYYPPGTGFAACHSSALGLLTSANGAAQCGAFADLLVDAMAANGIDARKTSVDAADGSDLLIHNWQFLTPSYPATALPWKLELMMEPGGSIGMVPAPPDNVYGDLKSLTGIAGQNASTPSEKGFTKHFVVFVPVAGLPVFFYDPSYGITFNNPQDFQNRAVAGFYMRMSGDPPTERRVRTAGEDLNITFTVDDP